MTTLPRNIRDIERLAVLSPYYDLVQSSRQEIAKLYNRQQETEFTAETFDPLLALQSPESRDWKIETDEQGMIVYYSHSADRRHGSFVPMASGEFLKITQKNAETGKLETSFIHYSQVYEPSQEVREFFSFVHMVLAISYQIYQSTEAELDGYMREAALLNEQISALNVCYNRLNMSRLDDVKGDQNRYLTVAKNLLQMLQKLRMPGLPREVITGPKTITPFVAEIQREDSWGYNREKFFQFFGLPVDENGLLAMNKDRIVEAQLLASGTENSRLTREDFERYEQATENQREDWKELEEEDKKRAQEKKSQEKSAPKILKKHSFGQSPEEFLLFLGQGAFRVHFHLDATGGVFWSNACLSSSEPSTISATTEEEDELFQPTGPALASVKGKPGFLTGNRSQQLDAYVDMNSDFFAEKRTLNDLLGDENFSDSAPIYLRSDDGFVLSESIRSQIEILSSRIQVPTNMIYSTQADIARAFEMTSSTLNRVTQFYRTSLRHLYR